MNNNIIYSGVISSIIEIGIVHPIDVYKTIYQQNNKYSITKFFNSNMSFKYKGFTSRFIGIVPMRTTFWISQDYIRNIINNKKHNKKHNKILESIYIGSFAALCQSIIDTPIEVIKINKINNKKTSIINLYNGFNINLIRNSIFASSVYYCNSIGDNYNINKFVTGGIGGLIGSIISHPTDYIKTIKQSNINYTYGQIIFNKNFIKNCMNGVFARTGVCFISMGIGSYIYNYSKLHFL